MGRNYACTTISLLIINFLLYVIVFGIIYQIMYLYVFGIGSGFVSKLSEMGIVQSVTFDASVSGI